MAPRVRLTGSDVESCRSGSTPPGDLTAAKAHLRVCAVCAPLAATLAVTLAVILAVTLAGAPVRAADRRQERLALVLAVGEQQVLSSQDVLSFSEGVEGIVDVRLTEDGSRFVVVGKRHGRTTLLLLRADGSQRLYEIEVQDPTRDAAQANGRVLPRHNIRLDFFFVQLDTANSQDMGVRWPSQLGTATFAAGFDFVSGAPTATTAVVNTALMPALEMAQERGWAKVLRKASVITAAGGTADFSSGGEVNIPVVNAVSAGFEAIQFGSKIKVSPRYDSISGRLELCIDAEVSDLSTTDGAEIPGRSKATLQTLVNMELGQSLVLAGLSADSQAGSRGGIPGLSQVPILGMLLGKHGSRVRHTENLIYIIPSLVESTSHGVRTDLLRALDAYRDFDGSEVRALIGVDVAERGGRRE